MITVCKTNKAKETKARFLDAARCAFEKKGYHKTTVQDIAKVAGSGHGTFYLYFKDKKDVFHALIQQAENELYAAQGGSDIDKEYERGMSSYRALRQDLKAIFNSFYKNAHILRFSKELALTDPDFALNYQAMRLRLIARTEQVLQKSGMNNIDFKIAAIAITGMIEAAATNGSENAVEAEAILPTITKIYFKAVS